MDEKTKNLIYLLKNDDLVNHQTESIWNELANIARKEQEEDEY